VEGITWMTTRIRMLSNNIVVIPNNKLAQSIVTNYYLPDKEMALEITVPVSYEADIEKAERILAEEAEMAVDHVPGLLKEPRPQLSYVTGCRENFVKLILAFRVGEFVDQYTVRSELRKKILKRFRQEGISMALMPAFVYLGKNDNCGDKAQVRNS